MTLQIEIVGNTLEEDLERLVAVWESSVRISHHFLCEEDIQALIPDVFAGLRGVEKILVIRDDKEIIRAFLGLNGTKVEMLFVPAEEKGNRLGTALMAHAIAYLQAEFVDVNEQNERAVKFYPRFGFKVIARDDLDAQGRPFPILHMQLEKIGCAC